jgi:protein-S-isoprenylcysteine O-methyltransferase Ste14
MRYNYVWRSLHASDVSEVARKQKGNKAVIPPVFPIYIRALVPLYEYATLIWMSGVVCLWLTRYTHQLGKRWGRRFYLLSSVVRPLGILLIAVGWLALYAPDFGEKSIHIYMTDWLPARSPTELIFLLGVLTSSALGVWAVLTLGFRRSFLYRHLGDRLITHGPYAIVRHPQFLAAIGVTFFGTRLFNPDAFRLNGYGGYYHSLDLNWALFTVALWVLSILEDRELAAHFGKVYEVYARKVPRLFPN